MISLSVVPMMACSPISHMGHLEDIGKLLATKHGHIRVVGLSKKTTIFTEDERRHVIEGQWHNVNYPNFVFVNNVGETLLYAYKLAPLLNIKHLNIVVGSDRTDWGYKLVQDIKDHKIKELEGSYFDSVGLEVAQSRTHEFSGTAMRQAVVDKDFETFANHLGDWSTYSEKLFIWNRMSVALENGTLKVKR